MPASGVPDRNPFEYGRELDREELVDREDELTTLMATIRNRGKLFLIGPRRFGKTSLLHACAIEATHQGTLVLRFDMEKYESLHLLAEAMLTTAVRTLERPVERTLRSVLEAASRLRPALTVDAQGRMTISLEVKGDEGLPLLADALDTIEKLAEKANSHVVVMLDEIQAIVIEHGLAAEKQLRAAVQQHRHVGYIFAGSDTRILTPMTADPDRPFYRMGSRLFLDSIPREAFRPFLHSGFERAGFEVDDRGVEEILEVAEDVPYNIQRLAYEAWEMLRSGELDALTSEAVGSAVERIVEREDAAYTQIWTQLTRNQKKALRAVIEEGGEGLQSAAVVAAAGISTSSMQTALQALQTAHLIRSVRDQGSIRYQLVDPFLAAWLTRMG